MFEEASNRITVWLSKTKIISSDQEVVCKWGMTHILDTLFNNEGIVFHLMYTPLFEYNRHFV